MLVSELIRQAYILAQVWDAGEEQPGVESNEGLFALNLIINQWSSINVYIPAYKTLTVNLSQGEYKNEVEPIITDVLNAHIFDSSNLSTVLQEANLQQFNVFNFVNVAGRPQYFYVESNFDEIQTTTNLYTYPVADQDYVATFYIKEVITAFTYSQDITNLPLFYFKPLLYQLAKDLSTQYLTVMSPFFQPEYDKLIADLKSANRKDLSVLAPNPFQQTNRRFRPWNIYG